MELDELFVRGSTLEPPDADPHVRWRCREER
jgi:hypothetical protein